MVTAKMNMQVMVKLSVAASSGKLDLSDCNLTEVPPEVCNIKGLEVSISCCDAVFVAVPYVALTTLPRWHHFFPVALYINPKVLDVKHSVIRSVSPAAFFFCVAQELSLAGNHLTHLPDDMSKLAYLQKLQLSGNYLESLPDSLCDLTELEVILTATCLHTCHHDSEHLSSEDSRSLGLMP